MKDEPNKITATLKVVVTGEFYDDDATEETLRYAVEQDLEDAGFDVDVALLKEQEPKEVKDKSTRIKLFDEYFEGECPSCRSFIDEHSNRNFCGYCGQAVKWND